MNRSMKTLIALAAAALVAPMGSATWMFGGSYEPNTAYDTADWMFQDPPGAGDNKVYFSGFTQYYTLTEVGPNPNVGLLETRIEISNAEYNEAFLGVWKDCNGDGYIGMAESAVREYAASLLLSTSVCPATPGPVNGWVAGAHNYNGWVSELVPIGRDALTAVDRRIYVDDDVRVWADHERPDEAGHTRPCPVAPQPRGTYQSTGGFLNFVDCRVDVIGATNLALNAIGDPMGWSFSDTEDARSGFLGQHATFGDENDANRAATVWDCSSQTRSGDVINGTGVAPYNNNLALVHNVFVAEPSPSVDNTDDPLRRVAGTVNHTSEGLMAGGGPAHARETRNCDTSDDFGHDLYDTWCGTLVYCIGEGDRVSNDPKNKTSSHYPMGFVTVGRGTVPFSAPTPLNLHGSGGASGDTLGLTWGGSRWQTGSWWSSKPGFGTVRTDLTDPNNPTGEIAHGYWLTFYAQVGTNTTSKFQLPGSGGGIYGSWQCGDNVDGIHNGFECDRDLWWVNPDGSLYQPGPPAELEYHELPRPGDPYRLRDVDCYDGGIGDTGLGIQPAYYGAAPCY